ncbi:MAG: sulfotransferase domain-containing protein [Candidatus Dependentiae bacterium]
MNIKKTVFISLLFIFAQSHAVKIVTTGAPKSGIQILANCIKEITNIKKSANIKGDMLLDAKQMQQYDLIIGTPVYNERNLNIIAKHNAKVIYIIRDPRDQIASTAQTIYTYRSHIPAAKNKSQNQIIDELITNGSAFYAYQYPYPEVKQVKGIVDLYSFWLPWIEHPNTIVVTFEHLSGAYGSHAQQKEIQHIATFLNIPCTAQKATKIGNSLQSGGLFGLFKKQPKVGNWKNMFNAQHRNKCKNIAGQLLIDLGYETDVNW